MVRNDEAEKSVKKGGTAFMTPFTDDKSVKGVLYSEVTKPSGREADIDEARRARMTIDRRSIVWSRAYTK